MICQTRFASLCRDTGGLNWQVGVVPDCKRRRKVLSFWKELCIFATIKGKKVLGFRQYDKKCEVFILFLKSA